MINTYIIWTQTTHSQQIIKSTQHCTLTFSVKTLIKHYIMPILYLWSVCRVVLLTTHTDIATNTPIPNPFPLLTLRTFVRREGLKFKQK